MKIYFCGSIGGGRQDAELYGRLISKLQNYGTVLTPHVGSKDVVIIAEVTQPSHGVGYEIGRAIALKKKILCLFRPSSDKRLSAMIAGAENGKTFIVKEYREEDADNIFRSLLSRMKIYFCGSIGGGRQDAELYGRLISKLQNYGTVLTPHVGSKDVADKALTDKHIHDRDMEWLAESDVIIAEVTQPSHGVGYEIGRAIALKKKILCLFRPSSDKRLSAMIAGAENGKTFIVKEYREEDADNIFRAFLSS